MKKIQLGVRKFSGKYALIDDDDFNEISKHNWYIQRKKYPARLEKINGKTIIFYMHRVINNTPKGLSTDHIDGNPLNNTKKNLRTATQSQNSMNSKIRSDNTSGYKGVSWHNGAKKWQAKIWINSKGKNLGYFENKMDAVREYDQAATKLYKEFARINII